MAVVNRYSIQTKNNVGCPTRKGKTTECPKRTVGLTDKGCVDVTWRPAGCRAFDDAHLAA